MRISVAAMALVLVAGLLGGCATMLQPDQKSRLVKSVQDFTQRLRWKDINGAAAYFEKEPGERFREMFDDTDDLNIVEVRVERVDVPETGTAEVSFEYDYFELPSVTLRSCEVEQEWVLHPRGKGLQGEWKISSDFPARSEGCSGSTGRRES